MTYLFPTNKQVQEENHRRIRKVGKPILKIESHNSSARAKSFPADRFCGLQNKVYLCVEAMVVLTMNLLPEYGLANGSTGTVKDFVWEGDDRPEETPPTFVWVDFGDEYDGPSFFPRNPTRKGWVPVIRLTKDHFTTSRSGSTYDTHTRSMIPLRLAWAWTIWKAQGQTIKGILVIDLGGKEQEHGLSYVAFLRSTIFQNVGVQGGLSGKRLTECISKQKKLKKRLEEDQRLRTLASSTLSKFR